MSEGLTREQLDNFIVGAWVNNGVIFKEFRIYNIEDKDYSALEIDFGVRKITLLLDKKGLLENMENYTDEYYHGLEDNEESLGEDYNEEDYAVD